MTLLLVLMDHQTYLVHKSDLPAQRLAEEIGSGNWTSEAWQSLGINELPRQVTMLDGLVIVSVSRSGQVLAETAAPLPDIRFSRRQEQILDCLMDGLTAKEIGVRLKLTRRTIDEHVALIKQKLEAKTIAQTVGRAVALGYWQPKRKNN